MAEARVVLILVLVSLIHAEALRILVSEFELGLVAATFAPLGQVGSAVLVKRLTHVRRQVLRCVQSGRDFIDPFNIAEAGSIEKQARILLLLLHEAQWTATRDAAGVAVGRPAALTRSHVHRLRLCQLGHTQVVVRRRFPLVSGRDYSRDRPRRNCLLA